MNFFLWYYSIGILTIAKIAMNYVRYVLHRFNIAGLTRTLISPWKRDISFNTWRGFRPILFAQSLLNNLITRFLGAIVRAIVLAGGFLAILFMGVAVVILSCFAALAPILLVGGSFVVGAMFGTLVGILSFVGAVVVTVIAVLAWHRYLRGHADYTREPEHAPHCMRGRTCSRSRAPRFARP